MGAYGLGEVIGEVFDGGDVLDVDGSSFDVIVNEVVFDVNKISAFDGRRIPGRKDVRLVVAKERRGLRLGCVRFAEKSSHPVCLLCGRGCG